MKIFLVDERGKTITVPYVVRFPGWTEERYYREAPREGKYELARGELIMFSPMSENHSDMVSFLGALLRSYCDAKELGKVLSGPTIRLEPETNREPDLCFIPQKRVHLAKGMPVEEVPSFVIEVSWTTRTMDLGEKALDYEKAGVREYWVVDIESDEVVVHLLKGGQYQKNTLETGRLESKEIDGFYLEVDWLWLCPLPSTFGCLKEILGF